MADYELPINQVICADCVESMPKLPDNSVDIIATDPPFFIHREVTIHRRVNPVKYRHVRKDITAGGWDWDTKWESEEEYLDWCHMWFKECARVLRKGGHFVSFYDRLRQWWLHKWGNELGMMTRQPLYWLATNPVPRASCVDFMGALLSIFWSTKGTYSRKVSAFNYELGQHANYEQTSLCQGKERLKNPDGSSAHPTQKPVAVYEWLLRYLSRRGEIVLDPFAGTGSSLVAAKRLGRRFVGIEVKPEYYEMAIKRLALVEWPLEVYA